MSTLVEMARAVYGLPWKRRMAHHLGFAGSTPGRWEKGEVPLQQSSLYATVLKLLDAYIRLGVRYDPDTGRMVPKACWACRECEWTANDFDGRDARGEPLYFVQKDLCSACFEKGGGHVGSEH